MRGEFLEGGGGGLEGRREGKKVGRDWDVVWILLTESSADGSGVEVVVFLQMRKYW